MVSEQVSGVCATWYWSGYEWGVHDDVQPTPAPVKGHAPQDDITYAVLPYILSSVLCTLLLAQP